MPLSIRAHGDASVNPFLFGFTAVAGRLLVFEMQKRAASCPTGDVTAQGYSLVRDITADSFHNGNSLLWKVAVGGEDRVTFGGGVFPKNGYVTEVDGWDPLTLQHNQVINDGSSSGTWTGGPVTPQAGRQSWVGGSILGANDAVLTLSASGLWTVDFWSQGDGNQPHTAYVHQLVAAAAGAYTPAVASDVAEPWRGIAWAVSGFGGGSFPGEPGGGIW